MKAFLLLFSVLIIHTIYSQTEPNDELKLIETDTISVNPQLPQYVLKIYETNNDDRESIVKIYVIGDTTLVQTIFLEYGRLNTYDEWIDINFDGYNDLQVTGFWQHTINSSSSFWLFNYKLKIFEESEEFSDFDDLTINKKNQTITNWGASVGWNKAGWSSTYQVVDNHLVLIEDEYSYQFDHYRKILDGDSLITVSKSYAESILEQSENDGKLVSELLWIITEEEMIYNKLRPIRKTWQWEFEGEGPEELYEKGNS
ncbi:MAG: hypothetical protein U5J96_19450 [Ignavibacteriaceae bacterium]|nr:hypothetical protein [Ignavibacteriaceae bacterium]